MTTRRRGPALEEAILDAGWAQLLDAGYGGFTFEAIAERAQTGKAALYRRWPDKEALLRAVLTHSYLGAPPTVPDTGSLRGDVLALLRSANRLGEGAAAVLSTIFGSFFDRPDLTPAQLRHRLLSDRNLAMPTIVARARDRGEVTSDLPGRIVDLPFDLFRHELIMNLGTVPDRTIVEIVDMVFLPLAVGPAGSGSG